MQKIEKEIKIQLTEAEKVIETLRNCGAIFLGAAFEKTIRFDTSNHLLEQNGLFLRVRNGFSNKITLKEKIGEDSVTRNRLETEIEVDDVDKVAYIFQKIGFNYTRVMEKYRMKWCLKEAEIVIDELPFGVFMEIEGNSDDIMSLLFFLNLSSEKVILETYWELNEKIDPNLLDIRFPSQYTYKLMEL